ncbi:MAG: hypothetical protein WCD30_08340, partial [Pseudolabrys sp.]
MRIEVKTASVIHSRSNLAAKREQSLFDQDGYLAGEWERLLALGKNSHIPVVSVFGDGQLSARFLI